MNLETEEWTVLIVKYSRTKRATTERQIKEFSNWVKEEGGEVGSAYQGSDEKIILGLKRILNLTR